MSYLLVPNGVAGREASVWVGAINENFNPNGLTLKSNSGVHEIGQNWQNWSARSGKFRLDYQRVAVQGLMPRTIFFELIRRGQRVADCRLRTLPDHLPAVDEKPFIVLLASCFCSSRDKQGSLENTYFQLPNLERPGIKILSGDQVYLDDPALHFSFHTHNIAELEKEHFDNYFRTWSQSGTAAGFRELLKDGANYFSSDDLEFWKNASSWASFGLFYTIHKANKDSSKMCFHHQSTNLFFSPNTTAQLN